jgi:hypothetical protein
MPRGALAPDRSRGSCRLFAMRRSPLLLVTLLLLLPRAAFAQT